jgi:hypothetical protein
MTFLKTLFLWLALALAPLSATALPQTEAEAIAVNDAFLTGLQALDTGNPGQAIPIFLNILAAHPDLVRVRLELGRAYFNDRQWDRARREFLLTLSADIPDAVRRNVLNYIRAIDARRGFDWDLSIALAELRGSENFSTDTILLDFNGVELPFSLNRSDDKELGLTFTAAANLRFDVPGLNGATFATTAFGTAFTFGDYAQTESLRDISYGARAGLRFSAAQTTSSIALAATRRDVAASPYEDRVGLELGFERRNANGVSVFGSSRILNVDNLSTDTLDGSSVSGEIGIRRSFLGRGLVGLSVFGEARRTDFEFEAYDRLGISLFGSFEAAYGLSIRPSVSVSRKDFLNANPLFVGNPDETETTGRLRIEKTDLIIANGFSPFITFAATQVDSGIDAFSYWSRDVSVGLQRVF